MTAASPAASAGDFRKSIDKSHRMQKYGWFAVLAAVLGLLAVFSAGFFLYTAIVVSILLLVALGIASANLLAMDIHRRLSQNEITLGETVDAWLSVHNKKGLPAFWVSWKDHIDPQLDVEGTPCHFRTLPPERKHDLKYRLHSTRRGLFRVGPVVMESSGPFGLVRRFLVSKGVDFVTVLPRVVAIAKGLAQGQRPIHQVPRKRSIFEDPSRFMGVRDYRPGDSMRRIHWRATARSQRLQVKLFEPSVLTGVLLAVDMGLESYPQTRRDANAIDPLLEFAVTAAASLGQFVLSGDQSVAMVSNGTDAADQYPEDWNGGSFRRLEQALEETRLHPMEAAYQPVELPPAKGHWQNERLLTALARLTPSASVSLSNLLMTELPRLPRNLVLMVITPTIDEALCDVLESLKRSGIETGVVWIQVPPDPMKPYPEEQAPSALPHNIPVYPVANDADLETLGGQSL